MFDNNGDEMFTMPERLMCLQYGGQKPLGLVVQIFQNFALVDLMTELNFPLHRYEDGDTAICRYACIPFRVIWKMAQNYKGRRLIQRCGENECLFCEQRLDHYLAKGDWVTLDWTVLALPLTALSQKIHGGNVANLYRLGEGGNLPPIEWVVESFTIVYEAPLGKGYFGKRKGVVVVGENRGKIREVVFEN